MLAWLKALKNIRELGSWKFENKMWNPLCGHCFVSNALKLALFSFILIKQQMSRSTCPTLLPMHKCIRKSCDTKRTIFVVIKTKRKRMGLFLIMYNKFRSPLDVNMWTMGKSIYKQWLQLSKVNVIHLIFLVLFAQSKLLLLVFIFYYGKPSQILFHCSYYLKDISLHQTWQKVH